MNFLIQFSINMFLAFLWMFLLGSTNMATFVAGFILGAITLFVFSHKTTKHFYMKTIWAIFKLAVVFIKELIIANIQVLAHVIKPKLDLKPGIIKMSVDFDTDLELSVLASMITLTPGTLTLDVADDKKSIYIHSIDCSDPDEVVARIRRTFEDGIKEVHRLGK